MQCFGPTHSGARIAKERLIFPQPDHGQRDCQSMLQEPEDQDFVPTACGTVHAPLVKRAMIILVVLVLVVTGLLMPVPLRGPQASPLADLAHAPIFATLAFIVLLTILQIRSDRPVEPETTEPETTEPEVTVPEATRSGLFAETWKLVLIVVITLALFGIGMEYVQRYFGRRGSWSDVLLNSTGLAAGICLFWAFASRRRQRNWWQVLALIALGVCFLAAASALPAYELWLIYGGHSK